MAVIALVASLFIAAAGPATATATGTIDLIVREANPATNTAETLVERLGGIVKANLEIIGGFTATVPASMVDTLRADPSVSAVTPDANLQLSAAGWEDASHLANFDPRDYEGSLMRVGQRIGAEAYWNAGHTGQGVDIAFIDSGVVPVDGLTYEGKVVNGPDLSFESQSPDLRYLDTFGHGTHLAGIAVGRDDASTLVLTDPDEFNGIAPGARIVSVKVADHSGATDVSQVIAAIDWVVQHRNSGDLNIRVLNLAFGTDSTQPYLLDPLAFAVEQAWNAGIVVVVAAGNDGNDAPLRNPAMDPFVIAVGATSGQKTKGKVSPIADFSNCGTASRHVDVVAPGKSIVSLRNPGSSADLDHSNAVVADRFFLGSGTSQASAVVSGAVALVLEQRPEIGPDAVKALLMESAESIRHADPLCTGAGEIHLWQTFHHATPTTVQTHAPSTGLGSLESARDTDHLENQGVVLEGEQDIFGNTWDGTGWSTAAAQGTSWSGGDWNGTSWSGTSWSGTSWSGLSWSGTSWSGTSWSGTSWSGTSWSGTSWSGTSWSGLSWSSSGSAADNGVRWD
jgi:serine protease AprX